MWPARFFTPRYFAGTYFPATAPAPEWSYTLQARQRALYKDLCDLWERTRPVDSGTPGNEGWYLVASNLPYYHEGSVTLLNPGVIGMATDDDMITTDRGHFPAGIPFVGTPGHVKEQVIVNRSTGALAGLNGAYTVLGSPWNVTHYSNKQIILLRETDFDPELTVSVLAAGTLTSTALSTSSFSVTVTSATGGIGPLEYLLEYRRQGDTAWTSAGYVTPGQATIISDQPQGTTFNVRLTVTDQLGVADTTDGTAQTIDPLVMGALSVTAHTDTTVSLSWVAATGGTAPRTYQPQFRVQGSGTWLDFGSLLSGTSVTVDSLTPLTTYEFQVVAHDSASQTDPSNTVTQQTDPLTYLPVNANSLEVWHPLEPALLLHQASPGVYAPATYGQTIDRWLHKNDPAKWLEPAPGGTGVGPVYTQNVFGGADGAYFDGTVQLVANYDPGSVAFNTALHGSALVLWSGTSNQIYLSYNRGGNKWFMGRYYEGFSEQWINCNNLPGGFVGNGDSPGTPKSYCDTTDLGVDTVDYDNAHIHFSRWGREYTVAATGSLAFSGGSGQLCVGGYAPGSIPFTGYLGGIILTAQALDASQRLQMGRYWAQKITTNGQRIVDQKVMQILGCSIDLGYNTTPLVSFVDTAMSNIANGWTTIMQAVSGERLLNIASMFPHREALQYIPLRAAQLTWTGIPTNDYAFGSTTSQVLSDVDSVVVQAGAWSNGVVAATIPSRGDIFTAPMDQPTFETGRTGTINPGLLAAATGAHPHTVADLGATSNAMGQVNGCNDTFYFTDKVHPTNAGAAVLEPIAEAAIRAEMTRVGIS